MSSRKPVVTRSKVTTNRPVAGLKSSEIITIRGIAGDFPKGGKKRPQKKFAPPAPPKLI